MNEKDTSINYTDLSRRGLIKMANDFDDISDKELEEFLMTQTASGKPYEGIRPIEHFTEKLDDLGKDVGAATTRNLDKLFGHLSNKIPEALDMITESLAQEIMEEKYE